MIHRAAVIIAGTTGRSRLVAKQGSLGRLLSTASASSRFTNPNYDVEAHHRQEILDALRTVRHSILLFVDPSLSAFPCLSVTLLCFVDIVG